MVARAFAEHGGTEAFKSFRAERNDIISLVAEQESQIVGTVLFSPAVLDTPNSSVSGMGLGQLAVEPDHQNQGIGSQLSEAGLKQLGEQGCPFVIVIGHESYYPRFGFKPCEQHGIECQWQGIPPQSFMVAFPAGRQTQLSGKASFDGL